MRCDGWGCVIFRPSGEIFREKIRSAVRAFAREFPHETARVHRGDTEERSGGGLASAARGQRVDWGNSKHAPGARYVQKIAYRAPDA